MPDQMPPPKSSQISGEEKTTRPPDDAHARFASHVSLGVSIVLLGLKFWAYRLTSSQAIFSDAMESIVNVVAAGLAILVLVIAYKPADQNHPYGHGKVEFFSAAFEGGLIAFASVVICFEAIHSFVHGARVNDLSAGLLITVAAGLANAALGIFLRRTGRRHQSATLEASGQHVLSDFWTSAGVVIGLVLVRVTGLRWFDPLAALIVGLSLGYTGFRLVQRSVSGLLDQEDRTILENLLKIIGRVSPVGIIQLHHVRVIRSGRYHHIDAHAVVPEFWDVAEAHSKTSEFETRVMRDYPYNGELHLHVDPCRRAYCRHCDVPDCPIRQHAFVEKHAPSIEELTNPDEPLQFKPV
jgi:cation diffusion facilitator family transporter